MSKGNTKRALAMIAGAFALVTAFIMDARAQSALESSPGIRTPLEPLRPGISGGQLFEELTAHNELRKSELRDYTVLRTYQVVDLQGKVHAEEIGQMEENVPRHFRIRIRTRLQDGTPSTHLERDQNTSRQGASRQRHLARELFLGLAGRTASRTSPLLRRADRPQAERQISV